MTNKYPQILDIELPNSAEVERLVLADAVTSREMLADIIPLIDESYFSSPARCRIWTQIVDRFNRGYPLDMVTAHQLFKEDFNNEIAPKLVDAGTTYTTLLHARQLRQVAAQRRAYNAATAFLSQALQSGATEEEILASVEQFGRAVEGPAPLIGDKYLCDVLADVKAEAKEVEKAAKEGKSFRISSGFQFMDMALNGGFKAGQVIVLAARPSVGKTAVMLQMAKSAAAAGNPVTIFSLEMTAEELGERLLFSTGKVRPFELSQGTMQWDAYTQGEGQIIDLPIYINDFSRSLDELVCRLGQAVKQGRCKIAFIDYLGLISDALNFGNAKLYQMIGKITGTLKATAKRLRIPIVLLCQLNRMQALEKRAPELYDLRDSGSIEQDADVVLMLEAKPEEKRLYAWLRKNRNGKKEIAFVLRPNETYSAFEEFPPVALESDIPERLREEMNRVEVVNEAEEEEEDNDDNLPF